jgi:hypothetical protein
MPQQQQQSNSSAQVYNENFDYKRPFTSGQYREPPILPFNGDQKLLPPPAAQSANTARLFTADTPQFNLAQDHQAFGSRAQKQYSVEKSNNSYHRH